MQYLFGYFFRHQEATKPILEQQHKAVCQCSLIARLPVSLPLCSLATVTSQKQQGCQGTPSHRDNHESSRMPTSCWHYCSSQGWDKPKSNVQQTGARCPPHCDLPTLAKASLSSSSSSLEICMVLAISRI